MMNSFLAFTCLLVAIFGIACSQYGRPVIYPVNYCSDPGCTVCKDEEIEKLDPKCPPGCIAVYRYSYVTGYGVDTRNPMCMYYPACNTVAKCTPCIAQCKLTMNMTYGNYYEYRTGYRFYG